MTRSVSSAPASSSAAARRSSIAESSALTFCGRLRKMRATAPSRWTSTMLSSYSREALKKVSTATLTTVLFKRGLRNTFIQGVFLLNRSAPRMVGEAYTLRYIPAREDIDQLGAFEGRGHPQREAIDAERAYDWGLIEALCEESELDAEVSRLVAKLLAGDRTALRMQKELLQQWEEQPLAACIAGSVERFAEAYAGGAPMRRAR